MSLFESILGAVVPKLVGGLFQKKPQPQTTSINYQQMVDKARSAGFNPLTALRNGGSSGFQTVTPSLASSNFVGDALQAGFTQAFGYKQDQLDAEREKLQTEIMRQDLSNAKAQGNIWRNYGFTPPSVTTYTGQHEYSGNDNQGPVLRDKPYPIGRPDRSGTLGPQPTKTENLYVDVYDQQTGRTTRILNPDLMDMGITEVANSSSMIGAADAVQNGIPKAKKKAQSINFPSWGDLSFPSLAPSAPSYSRPKSRSSSKRSYRSSTLTNAQ